MGAWVEIQAMIHPYPSIFSSFFYLLVGCWRLICIILHQNPAKWIMNQKGTADQDDVNDVIKHRFDLFDAKR